MENYRIADIIGKGKFSQIFKAKNLKNNKDFTVKVLKPGSVKRFMREVQVLNYLKGVPHIQEFREALKNPIRNVYSLVLEHYDFDDFE